MSENNDHKWKSQGFMEVDLSKKGRTHNEAKNFLSSNIIGQDRAVDHVARALQRKGFKEPNLPIATFLFAGPTGVGKTEMAKAISRHFIGHADPAPLIHIDCQNFQQSHELSGLIGSPPGYVGYDNEPRLSQRNINKPYIRFMRQMNKKFAKDVEDAEKSLRSLNTFLKNTNDMNQCIKELKAITSSLHDKYGDPKSVILFDEIEKAHDDFHNFVLNIVAEGKMKLNNPAFGEVSFANSIIIFTTNVGAKDVQKILTGNKIGFGIESDDAEESNQGIYKAVKKSLEDKFKPEFLGRIKENIVVFHPLKREDQMKVLNLHLIKLQKRFSKLGTYLKWNFTDELKNFILEKSVDDKYGMRVLNQKIEKYVESVICGAIETEQVRESDEIIFDLHDGKIKLWVRNKRKSLSPSSGRNDLENFGHS